MLNCLGFAFSFDSFTPGFAPCHDQLTAFLDTERLHCLLRGAGTEAGKVEKVAQWQLLLLPGNGVKRVKMCKVGTRVLQ